MPTSNNIRILENSELAIKGANSSKEPVHINIDTIKNVKNIEPIAAHIKEVNHIDPISVDALHVSEVKNIDPVSVEQFNITNLPMVNLSLRQLPSLEMNIRKLPAISAGMHQTFHIPSDYFIKAILFGIEFLRIHLNGQSTIVPKERVRREQSRTASRSFSEAATAGNPAIPIAKREHSTSIKYSACSSFSHSMEYSHCTHHSFKGNRINNPSQMVHFGSPSMNFHI